jgi:hypothetical protein
MTRSEPVVQRLRERDSRTAHSQRIADSRHYKSLIVHASALGQPEPNKPKPRFE